MDNGFDTERAKSALAGQLGLTPDQLKNSSPEDILGRLSPADREKVRALIADPKAIERLLSSPAAGRLIKNFMGNKGGRNG